MRHKRILSLILLAGAVQAADYPPAIQALVDQGLQIEARFDAPSGMTGYAARVQERPMAFYLTPDGKHVLIGSMLDAQGNNLTPIQLKQYLPEPEFGQAWPLLEKATWVREGGAEAERIVYVFTDPNCPYCNAFWKESQSYLGRDVQVRHIMVAILTPTSMGKAARILAAENPARALADHETYGSKPLETIPAEIRQQIEANNRLMQQLGAQATPAIFYRDTQGKVRRILGLPQAELMTSEIFQKQPR